MLCGCCRGWDDSEPTARTPLLAEDPSKPVIRQPVRVTGGQSNAQSVEITEEQTKLGKIVVKKSRVSHVDKTIQDFVELFNNHYDKFLDLQTYIRDLSEAFGEENPEHSLQTTLSIVKQKANCPLELQRRHKYCLRIHYEDQCINGTVLAPLRTFNKANKLVKELMDKSPTLHRTVGLVLKDERELRRDVLASSLGVDGPECMKHCLEAIAKLRRVPGWLEEIETDTKAIFRRLVQGAEVLCVGGTEEL